MMCFSRPKSRIRVDDLIDGLNLRIMTDDSARAKVAREGLATIVWHPGDLLPGSALARRARPWVRYPEVLVEPNSRRPKAWSP